MQADDAPPGFWRLDERSCAIDGVELSSRTATRFFQSVDAYPREWGRLRWRVQLNRIVSDKAGLPMFRTFYPGVEWNLNHPEYRWFLTAWLDWEGSGLGRAGSGAAAVELDGETALFQIGVSHSDRGRPLFLRCRVDARDRRRIAETLRAQAEPEPSDTNVIVLDDVVRRLE